MSSGRSIEKALEAARTAGFDVEAVLGNDRLLTLDLDHDLALTVYEENIKIFQQQFAAVEIGRWQSKSGRGWHVIVQTEIDFNSEQRAGFQAMLGSDAKRELLGYFNVNNRGEEPFVLFRPKLKS